MDCYLLKERKTKNIDDNLAAELERLGFIVSSEEMGRTMFTLPDRTMEEYEFIKNRVRKEYHQEAAKIRAETFDNIVARAVETENFAVNDNLQINMDDVRTFCSFCKSYSSTTMFVLGLQECLKRQLVESQYAISWTLSDSAFTEVGVAQFGAKAVHFLVGTIRFDLNKRARTDDVKDSRSTRWIVNPFLRDSQIREILRAIRVPSSGTEFCPMGAIDLSHVRRDKNAAEELGFCSCLPCLPFFGSTGA